MKTNQTLVALAAAIAFLGAGCSHAAVKTERITEAFWQNEAPATSPVAPAAPKRKRGPKVRKVATGMMAMNDASQP